jgi:hypothetical protein
MLGSLLFSLEISAVSLIIDKKVRQVPAADRNSRVALDL